MTGASPEKAAAGVLPMQQGGPQPGEESKMWDKPIHIRDTYKGSGKLKDKVAIITGEPAACSCRLLAWPDCGRGAAARHFNLPCTIVLHPGGDSGIGRAVALHFAREGADIAILYLNEHTVGTEHTHILSGHLPRACSQR